jgi:hypothetical protein
MMRRRIGEAVSPRRKKISSIGRTSRSTVRDYHHNKTNKNNKQIRTEQNRTNKYDTIQFWERFNKMKKGINTK